ncbi:response regulator [Lutibacter sp. B2]|nr:response regulator [Lutibacter sp. B2]
MDLNFYIVDDDKSIRKVLQNIICQFNLGDVVGDADNGIDAIEDIKKLNPDIVLIDLLLPGIDGITIVSKIRECNMNTHFIMISQVTSKEMISKAYTKSIEFFINKPINVIEVRAVIDKVKERLKMQQVIKSFEKAFSSISEFQKYTGVKDNSIITDKDRLKKILSQLGVNGEAGSNDIIEMIVILLEEDNIARNNLLHQKMSQLYVLLSERYSEVYDMSLNTRTIEQRIRRAMNKALSNLANLGIEDYSNEIFVKYSSVLFNFKEVRKQMDYARGKSSCGGKINVKKFIEGIIVELKM